VFVLLVFMLMLMSWVFSLAYASVCPYAYAYAYALVKTSLNIETKTVMQTFSANHNVNNAVLLNHKINYTNYMYIFKLSLQRKGFLEQNQVGLPTTREGY